MTNFEAGSFFEGLDDDDVEKLINGSDTVTLKQSETLTAALDLSLRRDWAIFPANLTGKEKKSYKSAKYSNGAAWGMTRDPKQIAADFMRWLKAGIGLPTGAVNKIWVMETDTPEGHNVDGEASLQALEAEHSPLPDTLMAISPSGSKHRYFNWPKGIEIRNSTSSIGPGIDVRGEGGMVIAPPSVRKDGSYRWVNDLPIADAPQWLIDMAVAASGNSRTKPDNVIRGTMFGGQKMARAFAHLPLPSPGAGSEDTEDYWYDGLSPEQKDEVVDYALGVIVAHLEESGGHTNEQWFRLTMAVVRSGAPAACDIFIKHASSTKNPEPEESLRAHFARCQKDTRPKHGAITVGTLLGLARDHGADFGKWRREYEVMVARRRAEQIRQNIEIGDNKDDVAELAVPLILTPEEMIERLVWIGFSGAVVDRVTFRTRKSEQATAEYAASVYHPKEKAEGAGEPKPEKPKIKTKTLKPIPCLGIWMHSPRRTTVDALAWVPGAPQFCRPPENFDNAQTAFNMWRGIAPMPAVENWQERCLPFLDHVAYLVPVESERRRFMQWLAHTIQVPEVLPHTAYLMVAEKTGIGRNWMASVLVRVLRGYVAAGVSLPELLDGGFNGRLSCKLLAIVDELREGPGGKRYERAQRVKSIITEENRQINPKYGIQSIQKNCCRWLMFSNFFDALPFDNTDRRIETIANPTVSMPAAYYEHIYSLLHDPAFIASVWQLLKTMDISDFKPGSHAAMNEAKERALVEMMTDVDRAVCDFRDECGRTLASRKDIEAAARVSDSFHTVNAAHLTHAITYAGMVNTGRRVKDAFGIRHPVVIVNKAKWTVEMVMAAPVGTLLGVMGKQVKK